MDAAAPLTRATSEARPGAASTGCTASPGTGSTRPSPTATPRTPLPDAPVAPAPRLVVTIDAAGLAGRPHPAAHSPWAGPVAAATAERLGCDSSATFVGLDPDGDVVEAGTQRRFFTISQRLAMIARDGDTCATPFCDRPSAWSDGHHLVPREQGRPTTVADGGAPLRGAPRPAPEGHCVLENLADGRYLMRHPQTGRPFMPNHLAGPRTGHTEPFCVAAATAGCAESCESLDDGESIDRAGPVPADGLSPALRITERKTMRTSTASSAYPMTGMKSGTRSNGIAR